MQFVARDGLCTLLIGPDARPNSRVEITRCARIAFDNAARKNGGFAFVGRADERLPFCIGPRAHSALRAAGLIIYFTSSELVELAHPLDSAIDEVRIALLLAQTRFEICQLLDRGDRHASRFVFLGDGGAI